MIDRRQWCDYRTRTDTQTRTLEQIPHSLAYLQCTATTLSSDTFITTLFRAHFALKSSNTLDFIGVCTTSNSLALLFSLSLSLSFCHSIDYRQSYVLLHCIRCARHRTAMPNGMSHSSSCLSVFFVILISLNNDVRNQWPVSETFSFSSTRSLLSRLLCMRVDFLYFLLFRIFSNFSDSYLRFILFIRRCNCVRVRILYSI